MNAYIGLPLAIGDRLVGVLTLFASAPLPETSVRLLQGFASQLALHIDRHRLQRERERFRELFIGMLGHDLRNPLSAIGTGAQLAAMAADEPEVVKNAARRIQSSSSRMSRMVDQLLDFAQGRAGSALPAVPDERAPRRRLPRRR